MLEAGRPLIGITIGPEPKPARDGLTYLRLRTTYVRAVELAGGAPVLIPPCDPKALRAILERLDGVVFPGGPDVDPGAYGETINHYNVLRTVEDMYSTSYAGAAASSATINYVWVPEPVAVGPLFGIAALMTRRRGCRR